MFGMRRQVAASCRNLPQSAAGRGNRRHTGEKARRYSPLSTIGRAMQQTATTVQTWDVPENLDGNIKFFWKKLLFRS